MVTLPEAADHLSVTQQKDLDELAKYVDAANEWVASKVSDTTTPSARLATFFLIDHWWQAHRRAMSPTADEDGVLVGGGGFTAVPGRVREMLGLSVAHKAMGAFPSAVAWPDPVELR